MKPVRHLMVAVAMCTAVSIGALHASRPVPETSQTIYVFGTLVEIVIRGADSVAARTAIADVGRTLQELHDDWHAWRPGALGDLNAALSEGRGINVDGRLADVLRRGRVLSCLSGGTFEPAIGALVALWGFHSDTPPEGGRPPQDAVNALLAQSPRMTDLNIDGTRVDAKNPSVQLDLGGYAKGAALDLVEADLRAMGIHDAVLNAGGDVNVMGSHGNRPWRVAIRDPFGWGAVAAIALRPGEVLYTSGNYERFFDEGGVRFAHIVDPRAGRPVQDIVSVSVLAREGVLADAGATALAVAGPGAWPQVAADMGLGAVLVIDADGTVHATREMAGRLEPADGVLPPLDVVTLPGPAPDPACKDLR